MGGEKTNGCALGARALACMFALQFDPHLPNESKTRQQRKGRPFKTRGCIVTDKPLAAHPSVSVCIQMYE